MSCPSITDGEDKDTGDEDPNDICSAIAAKKQPKSRRGMKKKRTLVEYYDFGTSLLGIEVQRHETSDPFIDPIDWPISNASGLSSPATPPKPSSCQQNDSPQTQPPQGQLPVGSSSPMQPSERAPEHSPVAPGHSLRSASALSSPNNLKGVPSPSHPSSPSRSSTSSLGLSFANRSPEGTACRTSIISHARAHFSRQHRTAFFQLVVIGPWVRFIRWDHVGAMVSERFDYIQEPRLLAEFLWRFAHMDDAQRGWDTSVRLATRRESVLFTTAVRNFLHNMEDPYTRKLPHAERTLDDTTGYPTWKIRVIHKATSEATHLVVRRPFAGHSTVSGRGTQGYIAYDLDNDRLLFLKDSWRSVNPILQPEFETYETLRRHNVQHVPQILYGGDVLDDHGKPQETVTQMYTENEYEWQVIAATYEKHIHHRIVQEIAYPLETACNDKELIQALYDVLQGKSHDS